MRCICHLFFSESSHFSFTVVSLKASGTQLFLILVSAQGSVSWMSWFMQGPWRVTARAGCSVALSPPGRAVTWRSGPRADSALFTWSRGRGLAASACSLCLGLLVRTAHCFSDPNWVREDTFFFSSRKRIWVLRLRVWYSLRYVHLVNGFWYPQPWALPLCSLLHSCSNCIAFLCFTSFLDLMFQLNPSSIKLKSDFLAVSERFQWDGAVFKSLVCIFKFCNNFAFNQCHPIYISYLI